MTAFLAVALLAVLGESSPAFFYAHEVAERGAAAVPEPGVWQVHLWLPRGEAGGVEIGGQVLKAEAPKEGEAPAAWVHAGEAGFAESEAPAVLDANVLGLALTANARWRGAEAMRHLRVYPESAQAVDDARARETRHTDTRFTMPHFDTLAQWEPFAETLRRRILISSGLLPLPDKTPLNARVFDRFEGDGFTVEKVHFEARPGFLVTGNLYRPATGAGPFPAVVCPHGHWSEGRLAHEERGSVPGRSITLARMGCVAFSYDMIGYVDSVQFKHNWGGPREELWGLHPFAMQLWSGIRAVDFVQSLPDVDPERIACTGASGGGTQTFALTAVEPRVRAAAPVNMISANMQGGCLCENAPLIRLDNSNMEIGALAAPRPLLLVSATGDWTRETPRVEFPAIRSVFALYGMAERVENVHIDAGHNYNLASREAMYRFFGAWLLNEPTRYAEFAEPAFTVPPEAALRVFPDDKPPADLPDAKEIIEQTIADTRAKWDAVLPENEADFEAFRAQYGAVLEDVTGAHVPGPNDLVCERTGFQEYPDYVLESWVLGRKGADDAIPALFYRGKDAGPQDAALLVHGQGKAALADFENAGPGPRVRALLDAGKAVLAIDVFLTGEHHAPRARTERLNPGRFLTTFQPTDTAHRIQDAVTALAWLRARRDLTGLIELEGREDGGIWALFASAIDGRVETTVADFNHFDPEDDQAWVDRFFLPCVRAVGDVRTAAALIHPRALTIENHAGAQPQAALHGAE